MEQFIINYFNQKKVGYFGTLVDAVDYAESFAGSLALSYKGEITIADESGRIVARQRWTEDPNGCSTPSDWEA